MENRTGLLYPSKLPVLTTRYAQPRPRRLPRIMENVSRPTNGLKSVVFYKNGDKYFQGHHVIITQRKYRSFDSLLTELTRVTKLPHGVRFLLTPKTGKRIDSLEELEDGKSYIASSFNRLRKITYGPKNEDSADHNNNNRRDPLTRKLDNVRLEPLKYQPESQSRESKKRSPISTSKATIVKPRLVTVIRNGFRPRRIVKVLLNRRTAQTFEQVLDDVTSAVGVIGGSGVRKLYSIDGKPVQGLSDLFNSEAQVFIAVGDEKFHAHDLQDILKESQIGKPDANVKQKNRKKSRHQKEVPSKVVQNYNEDDDSNIQPSDSARGTIRDDLSVGSHKNSIKKKHTKLPDIKEHGAYKESKVINHNNDAKHEDDILPPIDPNNNVNHHDNEKVVNQSTSSHTTPRKDEANFPTEPAESPKKKPIDNIGDLFDIGKKLGDGNFAVVRECFHKTTNEKFALKIIDRRKLKGKEKMLEDEIRIMKQCNHPNIVKLFDDYHGEKEIYLLMELIPGGDLFDAISTAVKFSEEVAANYVHDICSSLYYLHKRKIIHRDLKPENLLVYEGQAGRKTLKLADFGLAMEVKEPIFTVCGTPTYVAPEILRESGYGLKVDMWAAGVISYIMLCGFPPFRSTKRRQTELFDLIQSGVYEFLSPYWDEVSDEAKEFVSCLLVVDIPKRYSAEMALNHQWVKRRISESRGTASIAADEYADESNVSVSKFKTAAISVQSVQRLKMLAADLNRGEKILTHVK